MYTTACRCGYDIVVTQAMCGSSTTCPRCDWAVPVPSLSKLKRNDGESVSMDSVAVQVTTAVNEKRPPFDGRCQMCSQNRASELLPTQLVILEERNITGSEFSVSGTGVKIGYAPAEESWHQVFIPCLFCDACAVSFRRKWRSSWLNAQLSNLIRMIWVVPLAGVAIVLIAILPFVGWTAGAFVIYVIYKNLIRKSADVFLATHIRGLGMVAELLEEDEYFLEHDHFRSIPWKNGAP
jgi:hypothetical protein